MAAPYPATFESDDGAVLRWQPIPSYAELLVRRGVLESEQDAVRLLQYEYQVQISRFNWTQEHTDAARWTRRAEEAQLRERMALDDVIHAIHCDMWDHTDMRNGRMPGSRKRRNFCLRVCDTFTVDANVGEWNRRRRAWIRAHQPPDVVEELRAKARERWRKAAYLLGILSFWKRVGCAPGSLGARAAIARLEKRARSE